jgi:hypothetical protein
MVVAGHNNSEDGAGDRAGQGVDLLHQGTRLPLLNCFHLSRLIVPRRPAIRGARLLREADIPRPAIRGGADGGRPVAGTIARQRVISAGLL